MPPKSYDPSVGQCQTLSLFAVVLFVALAPGSAAAAPVSAGSMRDLKDHFAGCLHPSKAAAGSRVTYYFSLNTKGEVVAAPRVAVFGFKGSAGDKNGLIANARASFAECLPLKMETSLAESIPGKVYFLQYAVDESGKITEVLFRPFGSHGDGRAEPPLELNPLPETEGPEPVVPLTSAQLPPWAMRSWPVRPFGVGRIWVVRPRMPLRPSWSGPPMR